MAALEPTLPGEVIPTTTETALDAVQCFLRVADSITRGEPEIAVIAGIRILTSGLRIASLPPSSEPPLAEAATAMTLSSPGSNRPGARVTLGGAVLHCTPLIPEVIQQTIGAALEVSALRASQIRQILSATTAPDARRTELEAIIPDFQTQQRLDLPHRLGNAGASNGLLAIQTAFQENMPTLVLACESTGCGAVVVGTV